MRNKCLAEYIVKTEHSPSSSDVPAAGPSSISLDYARRPRRDIAITYIIPDSDDEMIADEEEDDVMKEVYTIVKRRKAESNLQKWIKHLTPLLREEQRKVNTQELPYQVRISNIERSTKKKGRL